MPPDHLLAIGAALRLDEIARSLGLPLEPEPAAHVIPTAPEKAIDLGWVNGHYSGAVGITWAAGSGSRGRPRERARSLAVPSGRMPKGRPVSTRAGAAAFMVPSPPPRITRSTAIDLGWVNGHYYFNVASVGFSADLASELTAEAKKTWGTVGYAIGEGPGAAQEPEGGDGIAHRAPGLLGLRRQLAGEIGGKA
jgi:hypothetical protein